MLDISIMQPAHRPPSALAEEFVKRLSQALDGVGTLLAADAS
jgi:hypothetical protein